MIIHFDYYQAKNMTSRCKNVAYMIKLNLIREALSPTEDDETIYEIVDIRILHMIRQCGMDIFSRIAY